jgi:hypothetical protein
MGVLGGRGRKRKNKPKALIVKGLERKIKLWKTFFIEPILTAKNRQNEH